MKILIKYPSRGRSERFFEGMDSIYTNLYDIDNFHVACTLDRDDPVMYNAETTNRIGLYKNTSIQWGTSNSKVDAINRDMPDVEWDILVVMSDDMRFTFYGFDEIIRNEFRASGLDTLLHLPDQDAKADLATMYIAGKTYYNRFDYIYHHSYKSLFCDNEVMLSARMLNKYRFANIPGVITHLNPAYGHLPKDDMFNEQQAIGYTADQVNYNLRASQNFGLHEAVNINTYGSR